VAKVVEVGIGHAAGYAGDAPYRVEVVPAEDATLWQDEDEARTVRCGVGREVFTKFGNDLGGECDTAVSIA
jgi:hypothetical protein